MKRKQNRLVKPLLATVVLFAFLSLILCRSVCAMPHAGGHRDTDTCGHVSAAMVHPSEDAAGDFPDGSAPSDHEASCCASSQWLLHADRSNDSQVGWTGVRIDAVMDPVEPILPVASLPFASSVDPPPFLPAALRLGPSHLPNAPPIR